jgi:hypothetical protein
MSFKKSNTPNRINFVSCIKNVANKEHHGANYAYVVIVLAIKVHNQRLKSSVLIFTYIGQLDVEWLFESLSHRQELTKIKYRATTYHKICHLVEIKQALD